MAEGSVHSAEADASRRLKFAIVLTASVLAAEIAGGIWSNSLALLSDAAHVFMDVAALSLGLLALHIAARPVDDRRTYGWHRAEVLAALTNGALLVLVALGILREAWGRFAAQQAGVRAAGMMAVAAVGLVANAIVALRLRGHRRGDLNLRAAFLHVLGDLFASVGVVVGGALILATGRTWIDPLLAALIAVLIVVGALRVLRDALHILLEGVPKGLDLNEVAQAIGAVDGVAAAHHLHIWSICSNVLVLSCHVEAEQPRRSSDALVAQINAMLKERFGIVDTTIQIDDVRGPHEGLIAGIEHIEPHQPPEPDTASGDPHGQYAGREDHL